MARYVASDTHQLFVNGSLESLLPRCSVARSLWQGVCTLDFPGFDAKYNNDREGRPAIDPRRLAAVWILALMRGVTSSVQVARLCDMDIEFRWLSGDCCVAKSQCCPQSKLGRSVNRALYAELLEQVAERVASPSGQWYNRARKVTMEGAFARLTELLNWRRCRCWGTAGATAEGLWRTISHNLLLLIGHWKPLVHQGAPAG